MSFHEIPHEIHSELAEYLDGPSLFMLSLVDTAFFSVYMSMAAIHTADNIVYDAARLGYISLVEFMRGLGYRLRKKHISAAVIGGQLETVLWLYDEGCKFPENICEDAAHYNHFDVLKFLHGIGNPITQTVLNYAAMNNSVPMSEWAWATGGYDYQMHSHCTYATSYGSLDILKWMYANFPGIVNIVGLCEDAAWHGQVDALDWLIAQDFVYDNAWLMTNAVKSGSMKMIEYVYEKGGELSSDAYHQAIFSGRLDILMWLIDRGCTGHTDACQHAALHKKLDILEYLGKSGRCTCTRYHSPANGHTQLVNRVKHALAGKK